MTEPREFVDAVLASYPHLFRRGPLPPQQAASTCVFTAVGYGGSVVPWHHCFTCAMDVCPPCARACHDDHFVQPAKQVWLCERASRGELCAYRD